MISLAKKPKPKKKSSPAKPAGGAEETPKLEPTGVQVIEDLDRTEVRGVVHSKDLMQALGTPRNPEFFEKVKKARERGTG